MNENDIVISGIAGRYPESDDVVEFWNNLIEGRPLYSADERRWPFGTLDLPRFNGKIKSITKTDYKFFGYKKNEMNLDPQIRIMYEVVYEAIFDAGIIPDNLRGTKTALFVGLCYDDTKQTILSDVELFSSTETGFFQSLPAVSVAFGFNGPTAEFDTACAASFTALREGILQMNAGHCDQMVIGGAACHLSPFIFYAFKQMRMISPDGRSKCLDAAVNGYCRSESINAIFVQKRKHAKRIYASIITIKTNSDGYKPEGITFPAFNGQKTLLSETIKESGIDPESINYIEAHVTGTIVGDPIESRAIIEAYREGSNKPMLFGCLKSNIGHTEGASANCAIAKVAMIFQKHCIPPNINFKTPNPNIDALIKGQIIPVLEKREFHDEIIPVNAFGFGGVNVHALFKANEKVVTQESYKIIEDIPRLVNISGRTEEGLNYAMNWIESNRKDVTKDFLTLLNDVSKTELETGMHCRSFMILDEKHVLQKSVFRGDKRRPLWFVFSALGCQWKAMGKQLMQIPVCSESIYKCAEAAKLVDIDVIDVVTNYDSDFENDVIKVLVAIVSMQVALVDLLASLNVKPDGIIGYSLGDVVAGYCDGCLTANEAILVTYFIGKCSLESQRKKGAMAAIGLNWDEALKQCPNGVYPACDNGYDGVTVSGEQSTVRKFISYLQSSNKFAVEVNSCEMAYHSPLLKDSFKCLKQNISDVIKNPKRRSNRWFSSAVRNTKELPLCDATFYATNVTSPVLFSDTLMNVPSDACIVEVDPHPILFHLIKHQLSSTMCVSLMQRNSDCSLIDLLSGIGEIYCSGSNPLIENLYPKVEYPVPRETLSLSHLLKWDHYDDLFTIKYPENFHFCNFHLGSVEINLMDANWSFLSGHCIDSRNLLPATAYLFSIWQHLGYICSKPDITEFPIEFRNIRFHRASLIPKEGTLKLNLYINQATNKFVITEGTSLCVSGTVLTKTDFCTSSENIVSETSKDTILLDHKDIYKELRVRGYDYGPTFQGLSEAYSDGSKGKVATSGHWISLTDSMLHLTILANEQRTLCVPTFIEYFKCEPRLLFAELKRSETLEVNFDKHANMGLTTGLIIKGLKVSPVTKRIEQLSTKTYTKFHPFFDFVETSIKNMQLRRKYEDYCIKLLNELQSGKKLEADNFCEFDNSSNKDFTLYHKLKSADCENFDINHFFASFTKEEKNTFLFDINYNDLIKPQLSFAMDNFFKVANIVEYNITATKKENVLRDIAFTKQLKMNYDCYPMSADQIKLPLSVKELDLIVYTCWCTQLIVDNKNWLSKEAMHSLFQSFNAALKAGGFLNISYRTKLTDLENQILKSRSMLTFDLNEMNTLKEICLSLGLKLISENSDDIGVVSLIYKKTEPKVSHVIIKPIHEEFDWIQRVKEEMSKENNSIWLLGDTPINGVWGLTNCLRKETAGNKIHCFIGDESLMTNDIFENNLSKYVVQGNNIGYYSIETHNDTLIETEDAYLGMKTKGDLSTFHWFEASHKIINSMSIKEINPNYVKIRVFYSALNFKDVMIATGRIPENAYPIGGSFGCLGMEFSGVDENNNRICGMCLKDSIATTIVDTSMRLTFPVPENWTLEESATVPVVYLTVYYSLLIRAQLLCKEKVLIHAGSGGVGQAAIAVCLSMGCEVFTSVGSEEKKQFLKELFPQLQDRHFVNSRDLTFEEHILKETNGRGVDVILNSLAEEKLRASVNCLADFGRFVEIGKFDLIQDKPLDTSQFERNITFHVVCVAHLIQEMIDKTSRKATKYFNQLVSMIKNGMRSGKIKPLKRTIFEYEESETAFRFMASGKQTGKVLIKIRDEREDPQIVKLLKVKANVFFFIESIRFGWWLRRHWIRIGTMVD